MVYGYLIGGLEHDWIMTFRKQLGITEAQLTNDELHHFSEG
jgi:hypothetical protein